MTTQNQPLKFSDLTLQEQYEALEELRMFVALLKAGYIVGIEPDGPGAQVAPGVMAAPRVRRLLPA